MIAVAAICPPRIPRPVKSRGAKEYAGMVELVDSVDFGAVTSGKVFVRNYYGEIM